MIFQSQANNFSISGKRFYNLRRTEGSVAEGCLGHLSAYNTKEMKGLSYILKDERSL